MARCIFKEELAYGELVKEYYIDEIGPYVVESRFEMMFHGWGDHVGEPGPLKETQQYPISFSQLREAAIRANAAAFLEIDESNWEDVVKAARPIKRKRLRSQG